MPASNFWDEEVVEKRHVAWMDIVPVRSYLNRRIGSGEKKWPLEWFEDWLAGRTFERALSVGCGSGALERQLVLRGLCRKVDAFDGSPVSLRIARQEADAAGVGDRIRYFAADFNRPALPKDRYDIVFFHQSAHHVANLEKLYRAVSRALKPDGLIYFDEYVGPSRTEWPKHPEILETHRRLFWRLPSALRAVERLHPPVQEDDPSEAIRSSEIESQLQIGFETLARRPYGGAILSVVLPLLHIEKLDDATLEQLIEADQKLDAYYAVIVARPKRGLRGAIGRARYWLEPKLKRVGRAVRRVIPG